MAMSPAHIAGLCAVISILGILFIVALILFYLEQDWAMENPRPAAKSQTTATASAAQGGSTSSGDSSGSMADMRPAATGVASFAQWRAPRSDRVYTTGTRLEDLLSWSALDASIALHAYMRQMDWEERDALLGALPQIANCILGLDPTGGSTSRGWLNEQEVRRQRMPTSWLPSARSSARVLRSTCFATWPVRPPALAPAGLLGPIPGSQAPRYTP